MRTLFLISLTLCLAACGMQPLHQRTLFEQLGGEQGLRTVADSTIQNFAESDDGRRAFDRVKRKRVIARLYEFLCVTADGPCIYKGEDMALIHRGLKINQREFEALVATLRRVMTEQGIPAPARNELLRRLAPLQKVIVTASRFDEGNSSGEKP